MKKLLSLFCVLTLCTALFAGCASSNRDGGSGDVPTADPVNVRIAALKGPTAMGMVQFMDQVDSGVLTDNNYTFSIAAAIDEVTPMLAKGELDIAAIPANVSSVLYNNNSAGFQVLAINTLGVLYIVESGNTVQSMEDLRGKTIYASGKGATPEYALNYILSANGIDPTADVTIEWKSEHAECLSALMAQENAIAMLPQPFVTTAQTKSDHIRVALDLTQEWDALQEGNETPSALITGVVVARREFVEQNPDAVSAFLDHYKTSVEYVNSNTDGAAQLVGQYGIVTAEVAKKALPACNITFIEGKEMQEKLSGIWPFCLSRIPGLSAALCPAMTSTSAADEKSADDPGLGGGLLVGDLATGQCNPKPGQPAAPAGVPCAGTGARCSVVWHNRLLGVHLLFPASDRYRLFSRSRAWYFAGHALSPLSSGKGYTGSRRAGC